MKVSRDTKFTFDDVLIEPNYSEIKSRKDVSIQTKLGNLTLNVPVISSNMDTITGLEMAITMHSWGGVGCLHRFMTLQELSDILDRLAGYEHVIVSVGLGPIELMRAVLAYKKGVRHFCIDVAHGANQQVVSQLKDMHRELPGSHFMVGNFATVSSLRDFLDESFLAPPHSIKVGIGPGSVCTTRSKTGVGYPQLSAILEIVEYLKSTTVHQNIKVIADGGMKTPGDVAKALAAGAHAVMLGGMLAGTEATPGEVVNINGKLYKTYRGSASKESYDVQNKTGKYKTDEGVSIHVEYKGATSDVLEDIAGGLRSALSYVGAKNLEDFARKARFVRVTPTTQKENSTRER